MIFFFVPESTAVLSCIIAPADPSIGCNVRFGLKFFYGALKGVWVKFLQCKGCRHLETFASNLPVVVFIPIFDFFYLSLC